MSWIFYGYQIVSGSLAPSSSQYAYAQETEKKIKNKLTIIKMKLKLLWSI